MASRFAAQAAMAAAMNSHRCGTVRFYGLLKLIPDGKNAKTALERMLNRPKKQPLSSKSDAEADFSEENARSQPGESATYIMPKNIGRPCRKGKRDTSHRASQHMVMTNTTCRVVRHLIPHQVSTFYHV